MVFLTVFSAGVQVTSGVCVTPLTPADSDLSLEVSN